MILNVRSCFSFFHSSNPVHITSFYFHVHHDIQTCTLYVHTYITFLCFYSVHYLLYILIYIHECAVIFCCLEWVKRVFLHTKKEILSLLFFFCVRFFTFNSIKSFFIWIGFLEWSNAKKLFCLILNVNRVRGKNSLWWII